MSEMSRSWIVWGCLMATLPPLVGCRPAARTESASDKPLDVAVSIAPQAWLVRKIGGPHADVLTLVQPADNPHSFQPTDAQVSRLMRAAVYFRIGMPMENGPWFRAIETSGKITIVDMREGITLRPMEKHAHHEADEQAEESHPDAHEHEGADPHIWLSPPLLKVQARTVAETLSRADPDHKADYQRNLAAVQQELDQLDAHIRAELATVQEKTFVVFHPAWGYFADAYGLKQTAVEIEGKQPTDAELTHLQREVKQLGTKAIFVQPQITGQAAGAIAAAVGARLETLDPQAEDVPQCLLHAAKAIAESYSEQKPGSN